jgi:hypothetical protein
MVKCVLCRGVVGKLKKDDSKRPYIEVICTFLHVMLFLRSFLNHLREIASVVGVIEHDVELELGTILLQILS